MFWTLGHKRDHHIDGPNGTTWFFLHGHDSEDGEPVDRIFFWDDERAVTGMVELCGEDNRLHFSRIKNLMRRIANDAKYRSRFLQPLEFPIERHW